MNRRSGETQSIPVACNEHAALKTHIAELGQHPTGQWLVHREGEPVFAEPWQAQVFALAVELHEAGLFSWPEWSELLGEEIAKAQQEGDPDLGDTYYMHWLNTLERMLKLKAVAEKGELEILNQRWDEAAKSTPHGQPISIDSSLPGN